MPEKLYLCIMEKITNSLMEKFLNGEHVILLKYGLFNGTWSDMAIETKGMYAYFNKLLHYVVKNV